MFLTLTTPEITENMPVHRLLYRIHVYGRPFCALHSLNSNHTTPLALGQINNEESASTTGTLNRQMICTVNGRFFQENVKCLDWPFGPLYKKWHLYCQRTWMNDGMNEWTRPCFVKSKSCRHWPLVYKNTKSGQKVVAWKQMIQLSGKYIIYVNKVILTIAAVKVFSDKEVFSFTSNLLESQRLMGYQMTKFFPTI